MADIRPARDVDREAVAAMLGRAFADDPAFSFIFPDPVERARRLPPLFATFFERDATAGMRLIAEGCRGATLWRAPGHAVEPGRIGLSGIWRAWRLLGGALPRGKRVGDAIDAHFPAQPFWYLHVAGCDPAAQGQGLGRQLIQAGIDRTAGHPIYLETATERNVGFYQTLGFRVTGQWSVPGDGPCFWSMLRPQD
ncbi:GNAT family N-acetyltransferase [Sphingomonas sp.]|uniref:GNAT family N-acetyltransferase n=1 Tax=Sphingomonas sp. TaxID=28214 RepID=UPI001EC42863|nr:GNAT family N-acetyltransferase [Sphingomonas sp.]MBX3595217.1 GNAT family N-acetyltransferase [Sphingomonas sp.]